MNTLLSIKPIIKITIQGKLQISKYYQDFFSWFYLKMITLVTQLYNLHRLINNFETGKMYFIGWWSRKLRFLRRTLHRAAWQWCSNTSRHEETTWSNKTQFVKARNVVIWRCNSLRTWPIVTYCYNKLKLAQNLSSSVSVNY